MDQPADEEGKGNELLQFFPEIGADLRKLPDIAIDGELVMLDAAGWLQDHHGT